jgi:glucose-6-phosphate 1-dehydrogenase
MPRVTTSKPQTISYPAPGARPYRHDEVAVDPHVVVLFGATGDLARRKLIPGLAYLDQSELAPHIEIVATSLEDITTDEFLELAKAAIDDFGTHKLSKEQWSGFAQSVTYVPQSAGPEPLAAAVAEAEAKLGQGVRRLHYLSVPPKAARSVIATLRDADLVDRSRVVMEKPFGTDLASAVALNDFVHETFREDQIFRIDHFLGKEAALNILAFRFANGLFEPIWNRNFIDHIQIDIPKNVVRGQFTGYRELNGVARDSDTETFIALKVGIDNWRWAGVPVYLRTGKRMAEGMRIISIAFKEAPRTMFAPGSGVGSQGPDHLTFDLADNSKVSLSFYGKRPGPGMKLDKLSMQFSTQEVDTVTDVLEAYERLMLDAMRGDHTLFTTAEGIESLWERSADLLADPPPAKPYPQGTWGPNAIHQLIAPNAWRLPFERAWREAKNNNH